MWTISMLKENAKAALRNFYWPAFFVCLIVTLLAGGGAGSGSSSSSSSDVGDISGYFDQYNDGSSNYDDYDYDDDYYDDYYEDHDESYDDDLGGSFDFGDDSDSSIASIFENAFPEVENISTLVGAVTAFVAAIVIIALVFSLFYSILFANPLRVGCNRFFLDARMGSASVGNLFSQFKSGCYGSSVKNMFIMQLKLFLWSLFVLIPVAGMVAMLINSKTEDDLYTSVGLMVLVFIPLMFIFLIPQMVKQYEYFLVPYITAENPALDTKRVFEISRQTMKGEKMHCFGLHLSFIGWFMLGGIAGAILMMFLGPIFGSVASAAGMSFIYPYYYATFAEFYCCMREKAMATGISDSLELNGIFGRAANAQPFPQQDYDSQNGGYAPYQSTSENVNSSGVYPPVNNDTQDSGLFGENKTVSLEKPEKRDDDDYQGPEIQ